MSFRTKLFLLFLVTVLASVSAVTYSVTHYTRAAYEEADMQRTQALVEQPVMSSVSTRRPSRWPTNAVPAKALACSLWMTYSPASGATRASMAQARWSHLRNFGEKSIADLNCGSSW